MPARKPEDCDILLVKAVMDGDLEAAVGFYETNATLVPERGKTVSGTAAIRKEMQGMINMKPKATVEVPLVVQSGDLAVLHSKWSMKGTGPDGKPMSMSGNGIEVVRRQKDGTWRFVIDNPFGGGS